MRDDPAVTAWIEDAKRTPLAAALERARPGWQLRRAGAELVGACPACGGRDRFSINARKGKWNCRGADGGTSPIGLAMHVGPITEFLKAVEIVAGSPCPRGAALSPEERAALARRNALGDAQWRGRQCFEALAAAGVTDADPYQRRPDDLADDMDAVRAFVEGYRDAQKRWRANDWHRQRALQQARDMWNQATPFARSPLAQYFAHRGVTHIPPGCALRWHNSLDLFGAKPDGGRRVPLHSGPAMLAPIVDRQGAFIGVQRTWLSWDGQGFTTENGKLALTDPVTGDKVDAKKVMGGQRNGLILLGGHARDEEERLSFRDARVLVLGEGRETVLSVYSEFRRKQRPLAGWFFADSVNLGNLGGASIGTVTHPTRVKRSAAGRETPARVPGPEPDMGAPGLWIPPHVETLLLLKDGDSDPFDTEQALERGARRFRRDRKRLIAAGEARLPLNVLIADAAAGMDFNDMVRRAA